MSRLLIKPGVRIHGIRPEMLVALQVAVGVFAEHGLACIVTSATEGRHGRNSLHYVGCAVDLRSRHLPSREDVGLVATQLRSALGADFDVVVEPTHFHIEFQPETGVNR